jgi:hypothetical protein
VTFAADLPLNSQQVELLCSCYPGLQSLSLALRQEPSPAACQPLLQLSALTHLALLEVCGQAPAALAVVAQLTQLKQLRLLGVPALKHPALVQLTALQSLEKLQLVAWGSRSSVAPVMQVGNASFSSQVSGECMMSNTDARQHPLGNTLWHVNPWCLSQSIHPRSIGQDRS